MPDSRASEKLFRLRRRIAEIEGASHAGAGAVREYLSLGVAPLDAALDGGLACGALHEACAAAPCDTGALTGFALGLAARASARGGQVLWIRHGHALDAGSPYGPGIAAFGLPAEHLLLLEVRRTVEALWAMEEGLKSPAIGIVIGEVPEDHAVDLTATRRLALATRQGGGIGLLLRRGPSSTASAALSRWQVAGAPGPALDLYGGLGRSALALTLARNRRGACGHWTIVWNRHERAFVETVSVSLAAPARHRPDRAARVA